MATLGEKIKVETQVRELLEQNGLPQPDSVEYGFTCIRLFFEDPKTVLIVDIDPPPEGEEDEDEEAARADGRYGADDHDNDSADEDGDWFVDPKCPGEDFAINPLDGLGEEEAHWN